MCMLLILFRSWPSEVRNSSLTDCEMWRKYAYSHLFARSIISLSYGRKSESEGNNGTACTACSGSSITVATGAEAKFSNPRYETHRLRLLCGDGFWRDGRLYCLYLAHKRAKSGVGSWWCMEMKGWRSGEWFCRHNQTDLVTHILG